MEYYKILKITDESISIQSLDGFFKNIKPTQSQRDFDYNVFECKCPKEIKNKEYKYYDKICDACIHKLNNCKNPIHSDCCGDHDRSCKSKPFPYRFHFICFKCRRGWKQQTPNYFIPARNLETCIKCDDTDLEVNPKIYMNEFCDLIKCGECQNPSFVAGYNLRVPKKDDIKS